MPFSLQDGAAFARDTAASAGQALLDTFHQGTIQGTLKDDQTLVTEADHQADEIIRRAIRETYPEHAVLSEEAQTYFPDGHSHVWVIDPLDGTTNFSQGLHHWGVSIALLIDGQPALGALHFPAVGELYTAIRGSGASLNSHPLVLRENPSPANHHFFMHCSRTHQRFRVHVPQKERTLGAAAYHFCALGKGAAVLVLETTVKLWDIAAAWLVLEEAGGKTAVLEHDQQKGLVLVDSPFPPRTGDDYNSVNFTVLAADTPYHLDELVKHLEPR
jgi:myo-inositol-1(or 4)-monophosphatase